MARAYVDKEFVELTVEQIVELQKTEGLDSISDIDRLQQLAAGLSTAATFTQIQTVARQVLDETEGSGL